MFETVQREVLFYYVDLRFFFLIWNHAGSLL